MKHRNPTLDDVGRQADISYQTVSRVLNGSAHVAEATRARVEGTIKMLNYVSNRMAQQLAGKRGCSTLGLITASLGFHPYGEEVLSIRGLFDTAVGGDSPILTRLKQWKIVPKLAVNVSNADALPRSSVINFTT